MPGMRVLLRLQRRMPQAPPWPLQALRRPRLLLRLLQGHLRQGHSQAQARGREDPRPRRRLRHEYVVAFSGPLLPQTLDISVDFGDREFTSDRQVQNRAFLSNRGELPVAVRQSPPVLDVHGSLIYEQILLERG